MSFRRNRAVAMIAASRHRREGGRSYDLLRRQMMADKFEGQTGTPAGPELPEISRNGEAIRDVPDRNGAPMIVPTATNRPAGS
jgi:hypothetical protein